MKIFYTDNYGEVTIEDSITNFNEFEPVNVLVMLDEFGKVIAKIPQTFN